MNRLLLCLTIALAVLAPGSARAQAESADRQVPVFVRGRVEPTIVGDREPIPLTVTVTNGLPRAIHHAGTWTDPVEWNGETIGISLVDVYRDGQPGNLLVSGPDVTLPGNVSGIGRTRIESGRSISIRTDARKWVLRDGWLPGEYDVTVRVDNLAVDSHTFLSVLSDPLSFTIAPAGHAPVRSEDHPEPSIDPAVRALRDSATQTRPQESHK
jgi:hypothetical protein